MSGQGQQWKPSLIPHEKNEKWTKVDHYTQSKLHPDGVKPSNEVLQKALEANRAANLPNVGVSPANGKWLMLQARILKAKHVLEVGLLGGYSTIWLASARPDIKITTIEINPDYANVARKNIEAAGLLDRVEIIIGSGLDVLPKLTAEVESGKRPNFDLAFIDANKENNWEYFDNAVKMSRPGGCVIVDNVVRRGLVVDESLFETDSNIKGVRRLIDNVSKDSRVDTCVLQTVGEKNYDGMLLAAVAE